MQHDCCPCVERLRGELADLKMLHDSEQEMRIALAKEFNPKLDEILARKQVKDATIATLREALVKYGAHEKCPCQFGSRGERIPHPRCGLDKALATEAPK